jgi:hypothetical protein
MIRHKVRCPRVSASAEHAQHLAHDDRAVNEPEAAICESYQQNMHAEHAPNQHAHACTVADQFPVLTNATLQSLPTSSLITILASWRFFLVFSTRFLYCYQLFAYRLIVHPWDEG